MTTLLANEGDLSLPNALGANLLAAAGVSKPSAVQIAEGMQPTVPTTPNGALAEEAVSSSPSELPDVAATEGESRQTHASSLHRATEQSIIADPRGAQARQPQAPAAPTISNGEQAPAAPIVAGVQEDAPSAVPEIEQRPSPLPAEPDAPAAQNISAPAIEIAASDRTIAVNREGAQASGLPEANANTADAFATNPSDHQDIIPAPQGPVQTSAVAIAASQVAPQQKTASAPQSDTIAASADRTGSEPVAGKNPEAARTELAAGKAVQQPGAAEPATTDFSHRVSNAAAQNPQPTAAEVAGPITQQSNPQLDAARIPMHGTAPEAQIAARAGQMGKDLAVQIAKHSKDGQDALTIRLDPAEMGRIQIRMHFDEQGSLRAHVTAESNLALELLRRESFDLARALTDAGVRTDAQSFRFDSRGQEGGQHGHRQDQSGAHSRQFEEGGEALPDETEYRRVRTNGAVDVIA
ncbi:flagellar hook-length control protein FliK [Erythrobacter aureus]|nr:flagellar hook-length control protein FliK [Erythrobacter aureus]